MPVPPLASLIVAQAAVAGARETASQAAAGPPDSILGRLLAVIGVDTWNVLEIAGYAAGAVLIMSEWRKRMARKAERLHEGYSHDETRDFATRVEARLRALDDGP